jgi:hypothetical protein
MSFETRNGWSIDFRKHVFMYYHRLVASKNSERIDVPCEDTPGGYVGIWPHGLGLEEAVLQDLLEGLREWARSTGLTYRLHSSSDEYETNAAKARDGA